MLLAAALLLGCSSPDVQPRTPGVPAEERQSVGAPCAPGDKALFPAAPLREHADWYGKHLRAAGEGGLCALSDADEVYRFTWLRTFDPPIIIRVERRGDAHTLTAKRLSGAGGYEPGDLEVNRTISLGSQEWARLRTLLDSAAFWSPPATSQEPEMGVDGSKWILEGVQGNRYQAVDHWSPEETGPGRHVRAVGVYLLRLARLLPPKDVY